MKESESNETHNEHNYICTIIRINDIPYKHHIPETLKEEISIYNFHDYMNYFDREAIKSLSMPYDYEDGYMTMNIDINDTDIEKSINKAAKSCVKLYLDLGDHAHLVCGELQLLVRVENKDQEHLVNVYVEYANKNLFNVKRSELQINKENNP